MAPSSFSTARGQDNLAQMVQLILLWRQVGRWSAGGELMVEVLEHLAKFPPIKTAAAERAALDMFNHGLESRAWLAEIQALPPSLMHDPLPSVFADATPPRRHAFHREERKRSSSGNPPSKSWSTAAPSSAHEPLL